MPAWLLGKLVTCAIFTKAIKKNLCFQLQTLNECVFSEMLHILRFRIVFLILSTAEFSLLFCLHCCLTQFPSFSFGFTTLLIFAFGKGLCSNYL